MQEAEKLLTSVTSDESGDDDTPVTAAMLKAVSARNIALFNDARNLIDKADVNQAQVKLKPSLKQQKEAERRRQNLVSTAFACGAFTIGFFACRQILNQ